jgi:hypothetical protein
MTEWRTVPGYRHYKVSNTGRVISFAKFSDGIELKFAYDKRGYPHVKLYQDHHGTSTSVHRVVASAFLGEPTGPVVRHLDDDKNNNYVSNLAYGTYKQNSIEAVENGKNFCANKTHCLHGHEFTAENTRIVSDKGHRRARHCKTCTNERARGYRIARPKPRVTHCQRGHELSTDNTFTRTRNDGSVTRVCRICFAVQRAEMGRNLIARREARA